MNSTKSMSTSGVGFRSPSKLDKLVATKVSVSSPSWDHPLRLQVSKLVTAWESSGLRMRVATACLAWPVPMVYA